MHDRNGTRLKVGDRVLLPCTITGISEGTEDYCNVSVQTEYGRRPDGQRQSFSAINTGQLVLIDRPGGS